MTCLRWMISTWKCIRRLWRTRFTPLAKFYRYQPRLYNVITFICLLNLANGTQPRSHERMEGSSIWPPVKISNVQGFFSISSLHLGHVLIPAANIGTHQIEYPFERGYEGFGDIILGIEPHVPELLEDVLQGKYTDSSTFPPVKQRGLLTWPQVRRFSPHTVPALHTEVRREGHQPSYVRWWLHREEGDHSRYRLAWLKKSNQPVGAKLNFLREAEILNGHFIAQNL